MIYIFPTSREHRNTVKSCTTQTKMHFLSLVHRLQSLAVWNTWELYFNFWPRPASFSKCTSFQHLHQSSKPRRPLFNEFDQPRFKEISMQSNLEENLFYVTAQFLKHVNQAMNIEHSQFFLLCLSNVFFLYNLSIQKYTDIYFHNEFWTNYFLADDNAEWRWHVLEILITPFHLKWWIEFKFAFPTN